MQLRQRQSVRGHTSTYIVRGPRSLEKTLKGSPDSPRSEALSIVTRWVVKPVRPGAGQPQSESRLCHLLALWASYLTLLCLSVPIYMIGVTTTPASKDDCEA